jgi:arylsulfatase A-like enzyme
VDTLRADHLSAYGYPRRSSPHLDQLAAGSVVFDRAIAQWPKTGASFASLFTGRYPQTTGLTHRAAIELPLDFLTLPEFFKSEGFTTVAVVANAVLSRELGWSQGFDEYVEPWKLANPLPESPGDWRLLLEAPRVNEMALPLLSRHAAADKLFFWIHYIDPHLPYVLPEGWENPFLEDSFSKGEDAIGSWFPSEMRIGEEERLGFYVAQYDANILVVDSFIREFLDHARDLGLLEDASIVFTSDHGESLGERNYVGHGRHPYNSSLHVPLFFYLSHCTGEKRRVDHPVELVDLLPTFRDLLAPDREIVGMEGESLIAFLCESQVSEAVDLSPYRYAFAGAGSVQLRTHFRTVQDADWKLIYRPARPRRNRPALYELYDLKNDPGETRNLIDDQRAEARRLRESLVAWMESGAMGGAPDANKNQSEETLKALRGLGYVD